MGNIVTVNFRGDDLYGFENDDGVFVAVKPICDAIDLKWEGQRQRLNRDPVLREATCVMQVAKSVFGVSEVTCLRMDFVNGWLFGIDSSRIKDDAVREKVILYQRECYSVLHQHFYKGEKAQPIELPDDAEAHEPETGRVRMVTEARQTFGARAAGQLWFQLGLPTVPAMLEQKRQLELIDYSRIKTETDKDAA
ncbi:phage antirepressor N-terminal domain-containing protein [Pararhizobium mangrovi]|uniref:Phage P22, antirepressor protein n=1 Tax=Pararhizobium mangrovi TaxID=2590452 RepID=A0A506TVD5_9HYPH|nr:phage antirepressor N-terminal domain-containing protein [Pararhizobium mangrovi]TPW26042.1 phage P22, antirepressor protein [Pararhizobium mangrovi]